jgi:hypothetical protein
VDTGAQWLAAGYDKIAGGSQAAQVQSQNEAGKREFAELTSGSAVAPLGRLYGNIAGTGPASGLLGAGAKAVGATRLGNAIASSGMATGAPAATTLLGKVGDLGIRSAGGAIAGGTAAGLVNPDDAPTGALIGGMLPSAVKVAGAAGKAVGRVVGGKPAPAGVREAAEAAQGAGYVLPPTQVKASLANRVMEGTAGKISTAQNASLRNQAVTNELAKAAIGVDELTPQAIQSVRDAANAAYTQLGSVGKFASDDAFKVALQTAGGSKALPGVTNKEVDGLVKALSKPSSLDAQQTIETIKRLRFEGGANSGMQDPAKKAFGRAQMKIAKALEDLIDRNLQAVGQQDLLTNYRAARTTLAKVYDVEKALTQAGNVDASKIASLAKKGRPLTGELKTIADFAGNFPKAAQLPERMGSLPQTSPLDLWGAGIASGVLGTPLAMTGVLARPIARAASLSGPVQRGLTKVPGQSLVPQAIEEAIYRSGPLLGSK